MKPSLSIRIARATKVFESTQLLTALFFHLLMQITGPEVIINK